MKTNVASGTFFYVFISVLNLFIVSVFWSFLLELFTQQQSKRLFGIIAAGGTVGALVGPFITDFAVGKIGNSGVLFFGAFMFLCTLFFQRALLNIWSKGVVEDAGHRHGCSFERWRQGARRPSDRRQPVRGFHARY